MIFTPTAILGSQQLGTFDFTASGGTTGTFSSGGIDYGYVKFTSGSYTLNVSTGAEVDLLIVGGGGAGYVNLGAGSKGGGGGGVRYITDARLYKGTYNVTVGGGAIPDQSQGSGSFISAYGLSYTADGGYGTGESGTPTSYPAGSNTSCGGGNNPQGGGGSAANSGSNAFCNGSSIGQGGPGGEGLTFNFDGTASVYGSGGGGGGTGQVGSSGGGGGTNAGRGGGYSLGPTSGTNGFGGGGGGEASSNIGGAGSGGHGIVIIRYTI